MKLIIVSGLSGSGKSVALNTLEDLGYYCVDNLPVALLEPLARELTTARQDRAAVGIDARNHRQDLSRFRDILAGLEAQDIQTQIVFLQASDETLLKRFSETRRKHPLTGGDTTLADAIRSERNLLEPISASATLHIDTTHTNLHQLRDLVQERLADSRPDRLSLLFKSFGYKHGLPDDADFVFDVRCLPNPHWIQGLRPLTGRDQAVIAYLEEQSPVDAMFRELCRFLDDWLPAFEKGSRRYLTVALGCTGGQHRSVYMAERLGKHFADRYPSVLVRHRELS
ncbi:RNase adapter RapZ [Thiohalobacter thiocyanaticus]|uniref:RNase adapter RapZ n=1 Tax=Thiohalobacter thiocyanaticus TaxID=585455 RepID=A0A426QHK9_9GAMM|nr:RNase adapter RapZ [Thiohalobacter thiocyanaticus]RRQ21234.1 RNase adapter RapZ [Thiohalobacter thiocyanaticus]